MDILFSIIIPAYNVELYIEETLNSVWNQEYKNYEVIIINDGSSDNTEICILDAIKNRDNVKYFKTSNRGLSLSRNLGIIESVGEYILFLDSDDILSEFALKKLYNQIVYNRFDLICFGAKVFYGNHFDQNILEESEFYSRSYLMEGKYTGDLFYRKMRDNSNFVASSCLYCINRENLISSKVNFLKYILHEDELFTRKLLLKCSKIYFLKESLYFRRIRTNSIMQSPISRKKIISHLKISENLLILYLFKHRNILNLKLDAFDFYFKGVKLILDYSGNKLVLKLKFLFSPTLLFYTKRIKVLKLLVINITR